mmetsp:Transcript_3172/g.7021  ORF Transcript_3172/g.7021 Transcript_3172/m.7021 type:complete len:88 (+) Transcript_3172:197-460(+)
MTKKSLFQKFGPPALARGLWGKGPIPTRYKVLFLGQSLMFMMAMQFRAKDVEKAQAIKKLQEADRQKVEGSVDSGSSEKEEPLPVNR